MTVFEQLLRAVIGAFFGTVGFAMLVHVPRRAWLVSGLIASQAEFQRLQSEAIAAWDPRIFAYALDAYPVRQFERERSEFYRKMFEIFSDIDPEMLAAKSFFG